MENSNYNRYGTKGRGAKPKYGHGWSNDDFSNRGRYLAIGNNTPEPTKKTINLNIKTTNRFSSLSVDGCDSDHSTSRKHKATSPAEGDKSSKKQQIDLDRTNQKTPTHERSEWKQTHTNSVTHLWGQTMIEHCQCHHNLQSNL